MPVFEATTILAAAQPTASGVLGGLLICFCIMFMLFGVTTCQAYIYMLNSKDDPLWIKLMVLIVWLMETAHSAFSIRMLYFLVIIGFGNLANAQIVDWSLAPIVILEGFFLRRMWILSKGSIPLVAGTAFLLAARIGCHTTAMVLGIEVKTWEAFREDQGSNITVQVSNSLSAVVDGIIALSMIYYLRKGQGDIEKTNDMIRRLMAYTVNSGAIMMIVSLGVTITYATAKESLVFLGFVTMVSKVYANCLYATLNARRVLRNISKGESNFTNQSRHGAIELSKFTVSPTGTRPGRIEIYQEKTQITDSQPYSETRSHLDHEAEKPGFVAV
ncbi:hypothetical protein K474DRAFT_744839 [Panus rudis PR-1116 ss-1]|nr:hypothetical protein K474DRAFT_744839 [Panus rudis PR-1116 ss-1]